MKMLGSLKTVPTCLLRIKKQAVTPLVRALRALYNSSQVKTKYNVFVKVKIEKKESKSEIEERVKVKNEE